jgi:D-glycero-D-manno-heptose 1,7-bisphosphate phosphatase
MMTLAERPPSTHMTSSRESLEDMLRQRAKFTLLPSVFLDRDGTLNIERGYITDPRAIELYPGAAKALRMLNSMGYLTIIISNQSAIGQGLMTTERFEEVNEALWKLLKQSNAYYNAFYYCPHIPSDKCDCRKPKPGLILQAALDLNIDLARSYMIGDKLSDIEAGFASGCKTILVLTGHGEKTWQEIKNGQAPQPDFVANTLHEAVLWIRDSAIAPEK